MLHPLPGPHHPNSFLLRAGRRSNKERQRLQPLTSVARAPLFEVRRVRFTLSPYWHTSVTLTNKQLFASQDANWWTGVVWITCWLLCFFLSLSAVWTLILTAPIHNKGSIWWASVMLNVSKSVLMKKTNLECFNVNFYVTFL